MKPNMLLLLFWAARPVLSDAGREGHGVDYYAMAQNKKLHGDRKMALKVINRNLDRAPWKGSLTEKAEVPSPIFPPQIAPHDVHQRLPAWHRPATSTTTRPFQPPPPFLPSSLATAAPAPPQTRCPPPSFAVGRPLDGSVRQFRKRQD